MSMAETQTHFARSWALWFLVIRKFVIRHSSLTDHQLVEQSSAARPALAHVFFPVAGS
jgi:hypothetical protein